MYDDRYNDEPALWPHMLKFVMSDRTCNGENYAATIEDIFRRCPDINTMRLVLPNPIVPTPCDAPTRVMSHTIAAVSRTCSRRRNEGLGPVLLRTLVIENLSEPVLWDLYHNPIDIQHLEDTLRGVENLVLCLRDPDYFEDTRPESFPNTYPRDLWHLIWLSRNSLKTLCIAYADISPRCDRGPRIPRPSMRFSGFHRNHLRMLEVPPLPMQGHLVDHTPALTRLELKNVSLDASRFLRLIINVYGITLERLYLDRVDMEIHDYWGMGLMDNGAAYTHNLWIGVPNRRPYVAPPEHQPQPDDLQQSEWWAAVMIRDNCPFLWQVRATELSYAAAEPFYAPGAYDIVDPSGLGRTLAQRFVEVVCGFDQPQAPPNPLATPNVVDRVFGGPNETISAVDGGCVYYLPYDEKDDETIALKHRPDAGFPVESHDLEAFRLAGGATKTSEWLHSVDGHFPNVPSATDHEDYDEWIDGELDALRYAVEKVPHPFREHRHAYHRIDEARVANGGEPLTEPEFELPDNVTIVDPFASDLVNAQFPVVIGSSDTEDGDGDEGEDEEEGEEEWEDSAMLEYDTDVDDSEGPEGDDGLWHEETHTPDEEGGSAMLGHNHGPGPNGEETQSSAEEEAGEQTPPSRPSANVAVQSNPHQT